MPDPAETRTKWYSDIAFITGVYVLVLVSLLLITAYGEKLPLFSEEFSDVLYDSTYIISAIATLCAILLIARVRAIFVIAFLIPLSFFLVDISILVQPLNAQFQFVEKFDFWVFLSAALLNIFAYFDKTNKRHETYALIGWSLFIFGRVLLATIDWSTVGYVTLLPLAAALVFWTPALWIGSRLRSSR